MNRAEVRAAWLFARYRTLSGQEREIVDQLLAEQVESPVANVSFDALAVIREFRVVSALPALRSLADRLEREASVAAPFEWSKVNQVVGLLVELQAGG